MGPANITKHTETKRLSQPWPYVQGAKVHFAPSLQVSPPEATILLVIWVPPPRVEVAVSHVQGPG